MLAAYECPAMSFYCAPRSAGRPRSFCLASGGTNARLQGADGADNGRNQAPNSSSIPFLSRMSSCLQENNRHCSHSQLGVWKASSNGWLNSTATAAVHSKHNEQLFRPKNFLKGP